MSGVDYDDELYKTYRKGRELSPEVLQMWMEAVGEFVDASAIARVIDVGAGTGRFSGPLADSLRARVIAVDPSRKMLQNISPDTDRVAARVEHLPFSNGFADLVFASMVLHHFSNLGAAGSEIRRVLKPGGSLLVRGCFAEALDAPYHQFFPSVLKIEQDLLPSTATVVKTFSLKGLSLVGAVRLRQFMDRSYRSYADRMRQRAMSPLRMISDDEFDAGMSALDKVAQNEQEPVGVYENIDLLHFTTPR